MQIWWLTSTMAWQLAMFALVFGALYGGFVALYPALTVDYFGGRNASGIIGSLYTGCSVGTLIGPPLTGAAFDTFGTYTPPIAAGRRARGDAACPTHRSSGSTRQHRSAGSWPSARVRRQDCRTSRRRRITLRALGQSPDAGSGDPGRSRTRPSW